MPHVDANKLSPEQAAELPPLRDRIAQAMKDAEAAMSRLGATSEFHTAGMPRIQLERVRVADANGGVIVPIGLNGVDGPAFEFQVDRTEALSLAVSILQSLQAS